MHIHRFALAASLVLPFALGALAAEPVKDASGDAIPDGARARLGTLRFRCTYGITRAAWAPDGKSVAVAAGNDLKVFDRQSGKALDALTVDMPLGWVISSFAWTPDGKAIVFSTSIEHLVVWTLGTKPPRLIEGVAGKDVRSIALSPDGKTVAAAGDEKVVRLIDLASGKETFKLEGHEGTIKSVAFSKDGKRIASAGEDKAVRLWDAATGKEVAKIGNPDEVDEVEVVAFLPDGKSIVTVGNQTVRIFEVAEGKLTAALMDYDGNQRCLSVSPDGKTVAANALRNVAVWSTSGPFEAEQKPQKKFVAADETLEALAYSPDGKTLAAAGGSTLRLFDAATGAEQARPEGHRDYVNGLAYSPDGKTLASSSADRTLALWDVASGKARWLPQTEPLGALAWSPDGKTIAVGTRSSFDPAVLIVEAASGKLVASLAGHKGSIQGVGVSPDGKMLVTAAGSDKTARIWDVAAKKELASVEVPEAPVVLAVAPDGKHFVIGAGKETVFLYTFATPPVLVRKLSETTDPLTTTGLAFSRDGKRLAIGAGKPRIIDVETGKVLAAGEVDTFTDGIALSPDGTRFVTANDVSSLSSVFVLDATSGKQLKKLSGQSGGLRLLTFSPDGKT
ncbi:MAG: WD40 repeat domain-containing protein, partial [Planctomycetota bacterium]